MVKISCVDIIVYSIRFLIVDMYLHCFDTVGWATGGIRPVKTGCWFVGGDILTGALHVL